jgi:hypothetical protein
MVCRRTPFTYFIFVSHNQFSRLAKHLNLGIKHAGVLALFPMPIRFFPDWN